MVINMKIIFPIIMVIIVMHIHNTISKKFHPERYEYFHNMPIKEQIKELFIILLIFSLPFAVLFYLIYKSKN